MTRALHLANLVGALCAVACSSMRATPIADVIARADSLRESAVQVTIQGTVLDLDHLPLTQYYIATISDKTGSIKVVADSASCVGSAVRITGTLAGYNVIGLLHVGPIIVENKRYTSRPSCDIRRSRNQ